MTTTVVNIRRASFDVYIGRAGQGYDGYFGNPFREYERDEAIEKFKAYFLDRVERDPEYRRRVLELKDKRLGCFCKPRKCHGDVIAAWLDGVDHGRPTS